MAYTAFRKSCGDFEVAIPAVDFSPLAIGEAKATARHLKAYVNGFVCHHLEFYPNENTRPAAKLIQTMILNNGGRDSTGEPHLGWLVRSALNLDDSYFRVFEDDGIALRKAWCEHMAREIEREHGLEPNPYVLEEH